jgi:MFS family permease
MLFNFNHQCKRAEIGYALARSAWGYGFIVLAIALLAIANITYNPFVVALVTEFAPKSSLGIYLSLNAQCWTVGYLLGPLLGGWALAQSEKAAHGLWATVAFSTLVGILILKQFETLQTKKSFSK